jgi:adenine phosphoribosyltransferase
MIDAGRQAVLRHLAWQDGHADVWPVFADETALRAVVAALVEPWRNADVERVVGIESRAFLLGGACALALGCGFVAIRKGGGLLPGPKVSVDADEDYRGLRHSLHMQKILRPGERVLLVDDWAERGSQAAAAMQLVRAAGGQFLGITVMVDQLRPDRRARLGRVTALAGAADLGAPDV